MRLVIASTAAIVATTTASTTASVVASTTRQQRHSIRGGGVIIGSSSRGRQATHTGTATSSSNDIDIDTSKTTTVYHHHKNKNKNPVIQKLLNIKRKTMKTLSTDLEDNNDVSLLLDLGAITPKIKKRRRRILPAANANNAKTNTSNNNNNNRHGYSGRSLTNNNSFDEEQQLVEDRADKVSIHSGASIRNPTNVVTNFMIPSLQYLCELQQTESSSTQSSFCDCENFDFKLQKGRIDCNLPENETPYCSSTINSCGEEVEICYYDSIHLESIGVEDDYFYTTCLTYTQPYQQQICTTFTKTMSTGNTSSSPQIQVTTNDDSTKQVTGIEYYEQQTTTTSSCDVTFNNKQCNSCETEIREYVSGENTYYNRCFEIDCGTGNDNTIINTCDNGDSSPNSGLSTLKDKIIFGDDCTKCQPCGIGYYMKNLMGIGTFPIIGEYTCSGLELGSKIGFFDRELCEEIQSQTNIYCDCQPIFTVSDENENENEPQSPSFAGGTVSSTEPEIETKTEPETEPEAATETETIDPPLFVLPGDTINGSMCHVCGGSNNNSAATADDLNSNSNSNSKVVYHVNNPNTILNLPDSSIPTTCLSLEAAGRLGFFTSNYCTDIVQPLVLNTCGGCTTSSTSTGTGSTISIVNKDDGNNVSLRSSSLSAESTSTPPAVVAAINTTTTLMIAEEESKMSADDNVPPPTTATTTTIQDNHPISCFVCDPDSELRLQNETVRLDEGESEDEDATSLSCSEFENALIQVNSHGRTRMNFKTGRIFVTEEFCLEKAHLLAKTYCGGCILKAEKGTTPTTTATTTTVSSDDNNDNNNIVQSLVNDALKVAGDEEKGTEIEENNNNNDCKYHDDYDDDNVIMIGRDGGGVDEGGEIGVVENEIIENENNYDNGNSKKIKPLPRFYRDVPPEEINIGEDTTTTTTNNDTTSQSITTDPSSASSAASAASSSSLLVTMSWSAASMMAVWMVSYHYVS